MTAQRRPITAEDLHLFRLPGDVQLSPDGSRIAYVLQEIDPEKNEYQNSIWIVSEGRPPARFTAGPKDSSPRWSPDGRHLAFVSGRSGSAQIWLLPLGGGEARQLTRIKGGVANPVWSPDGTYLAFTANLTAAGLQPEGKDPEEKDLLKRHTKDVKVITRLQYKMDGVGYYGDKRSQVCVIPAEGEAPEPVQLTTGDYSHGEPTWTPDGEHLLFVANRSDEADWERSNQIWRVVRTGGEPAQVSLPADSFSASMPSVSPDGRHVAFLATNPDEQGYGNAVLALVDLRTGALRRVTAAFDRPLGNVGIYDMPAPAGGRIVWAPNGQAVYLTCSDAGMVHLVRVEIDSGAVTPLTGGDRIVYSYSFAPDCSRVAFSATEPTHPGDIFLAYTDETAPAPPVANSCAILTGGGIREVRITEVNAAVLAEFHVSPAERFLFSAGEGEPPVDGWVIRPVGMKPGEKYPAILEIHGGPMGMYGTNFFFEFQVLAGLGYAVVFSNPRGSLGYGRNFCHCIMGDWGDKDYRDVMAAMETAVARYDFIDPDRLGVAGGSYGGFLVNWIVGHTDRFKAAVTMRSVVNRFSAMGTSDTGYLRIPQFQSEGYWWQDPAPYLKQSPLMHAHKINTPLLIEHQENDLRCPIEQGEQLYTALKVQKKPVKFVRYPGEFHGMSRNGKPWYRIHRLLMMADWFAEYLR